jgi:isoquinoline 1-oxidoreductase beta subunit
MTIRVSRRQFLGASSAVAGSLVVGFHVPFARTASAQTSAAQEINAWVVVQPDEIVVIRIARSEMGQGTLTGLAQLVAEELECDWAKVKTEYPTPGQNLARNRVWGNYSTGGSRGVRESNEYVRKGGATARVMLVQAAADDWKVSPSECTVANGVITHKPSGRSTTYGKVAAAAAKVAPPADVALKDPKDWKIAGKRLARLDTVDKTTGKQIYGIDLSMPGMLNAAIKDCPVFGGKVKSFDAAVAMKRPGVKKVVRVGDSRSPVVADTWWHAKSALDAMPIEWDYGPNADASSAKFAAVLKAGLDANDAVVGNENGNARAALASAAEEDRGGLLVPAPEPRDDGADERDGTMDAGALRGVDADAERRGGARRGLRRPRAFRSPNATSTSCCWAAGSGRRGAVHDWVRQVVAIAKEMPGTPVKLLWTREEDMTHGLYHPVTQCKLTAGLDADGNVTALHMRISGQSIVAAIFPQNIKDGKDPVVFQGLNPPGPEASIGYTFPNLLIDHAMRNPHVPPGILARRQPQPEHDLPRVLHRRDRARDRPGPARAAEEAHGEESEAPCGPQCGCERAGWGKPAPAGVYRGPRADDGLRQLCGRVRRGLGESHGALKIHRIVAATDPGYAVNPQQIEAQVEGSFAYGLSRALRRVHGQGWADRADELRHLRVLRMDEMPAVEAIVMPSGGFWGGVGEPTIAVAAPAVLNAIFAATWQAHPQPAVEGPGPEEGLERNQGQRRIPVTEWAPFPTSPAGTSASSANPAPASRRVT